MTPAADSPEFARLARRGLVVLTLINLFNYLDRYVVSALAESLRVEAPAGLGLSDFQSGSLVPAFMLVFAFTSVLFGWLGDRAPRPRLVAFGVAIWSLATALGGFAGSFLGLFLARALVGVGEAAYGTIAPALLADYFPPVRRGRVFAIFFAAIPIGSALGFILGGYADQHFGWRAAFFIAGLPGIVLSLLALALLDPPRGVHDAPAAGHGPPPRGKGWKAVYAPLVANGRYRLTILGYAFATFAAGGLAFWMPSFLKRVRGATPSEATVQFGVITAVTALVGTYGGGLLAERALRRTKHGHLWFCGLSTLIAAPFVLLALTLESPPLYLGAIVVGGLFLFASTGPVNLAIINSVRPDQRVAAVALSIFTIHILGDVPSPPLVGMISDRTSLGTGILLVPLAVLVAGAVWTFAAWQAERDDRVQSKAAT